MMLSPVYLVLKKLFVYNSSWFKNCYYFFAFGRHFYKQLVVKKFKLPPDTTSTHSTRAVINLELSV